MLDLPFFIINNLPDRVYKVLPITTILTLVLSACASVAIIPQPIILNQNDPVPGVKAEVPEEAEAVVSATIEPTPTVTQTPTEITQIEFSSQYTVNSIYTDTLIELDKVSAYATDFANRIDTNGLGLINEQHNTFHMNAYGIEYALNDTEDTAIFDIIQKINGKDTYLYATLEGGIACAKELNPNFDPTGAYLDFAASNGIIAKLIDSSGQAVCGVNLSDRQWKALNENGELIGPSGEIIPTPTSPSNANADKSPVLVSDQEVIDAIADKIIAGQSIDTSSLTIEQRMSLAESYTEKLNQQRGVNPVIFNNKKYIDPLSLDFLDINDGKSKQEQTIQMYLPAYENAEGYLMVQTPDGQWIQIKGSKDVKYEMTNDPFDPNINWPDTKKVQADWLAEPDKGLAGLTIPQAILGSKAYPASMIPIVILGKELGEIQIGGFGLTGSLKGLIIEKDTQGNPIGARIVILTGGLALYGDDLAARSKGQLGELSTFWQTLEENTLYYLMYQTDQKQRFDDGYPQLNGEATSGYSGLVASDRSHQVITGQEKNQDLVWIEGFLLMKIND